MIDLHVHSTASDGTLTPFSLVRYAWEHGINIMALTDHDTVAGVPEALASAEQLRRECGADITVIPGIEIAAGFRDSEIHILGYRIDPSHEVFSRMLSDMQTSREHRNELIAQKMRDAGLDITVDELQRTSGSVTITRAHFAGYLVRIGYCSGIREAFERYLDNGRQFYVAREYINRPKAIATIHEAGGKAVLAHPLKYGVSGRELEDLVSELKGYGLDGIETYYSSNISNDEDTVRHLAIKYDLCMTGGSDFHGEHKPGLEIGVGFGNLRIPDDVPAKCGLV